MFEKRRRGRARGSTAKKEKNDRAWGARGGRVKWLDFFFGGEEGGTFVPKLWLGVSECFDCFEEFLDCVLVGGLCLGYFGAFCGLKEGFYGEIKCGFLGFWIEKKTWNVLGLFEENKRRRWRREYSNLKISKQELKQQIPITKCEDLMLTLEGCSALIPIKVD